MNKQAYLSKVLYYAKYQAFPFAITEIQNILLLIHFILVGCSLFSFSTVILKVDTGDLWLIVSNLSVLKSLRLCSPRRKIVLQKVYCAIQGTLVGK
jgi:hypothetical protein